MFSGCYAPGQVARYQACRHKARIDHVAGCLLARQYRPLVISHHVREWLRFAMYCEAHATALPTGLHTPEVDAYTAHRIRDRSASYARFVRASIRIFIETTDQGDFRRRVATAERRPSPAWLEPDVEAYTRFLRDARGLAERTVSKRRWQLTQIGEWFDGHGVHALADILPSHIHGFFRQLEGQRPATRLTYAVTLRSFLRWTSGTGILSRNLADAVIAARQFRQAGLRDVLPSDEVERVLRATDRSHAIGRRDFAVLLLAARYGLRPCDIRQLRLDNLHWREGVLAIRQSKTGLPLVLPLLPEITAALVAYLRCGRPPTSAREVFVRHLAPYEPFVPGNNLASIMQAALRRAGLDQRAGGRGLYVLRHTFATRLLAAGCSLKTISDLMGHVSTTVTMEYANVDLAALRGVALSQAEV
jgi:integrase/recombinase XerD